MAVLPLPSYPKAWIPILVGTGASKRAFSPVKNIFEPGWGTRQNGLRQAYHDPSSSPPASASSITCTDRNPPVKQQRLCRLCLRAFFDIIQEISLSLYGTLFAVPFYHGWLFIGSPQIFQSSPSPRLERI